MRRRAKRRRPVRARTRKLWPATAAIVLLGVVAAVWIAELSVRRIDAKPTRDVMREYYVATALLPGYRERCPVHGDLPFFRPNFRLESRAPNLPYRFTTGALEMDGCRHGFRNNGDGDDGPAYGVVLGDSHSENIRLDDREGWVSVLSSATGRRFVNWACSGMGTTHHLAMAERVVPLLRPKVVLVQVCDNDLDDDLAPLRPPRRSPGTEKPSLRARVDRAFAWTAHRRLRPSVLAFCVNRWGREWVVSHLPAPRDGPAPAPPPDDRAAGVRLELRNLERIRRVAEANGARMAVFAFATDGYLAELGLETWCARRNVPFTRNDERLWEYGGDPRRYLFATDNHLNEKGNRLSAELIRTALEKGGAL
jgi:hypothetical protein